MADISKIQTNGTTYDIKDTTARTSADDKVNSVKVGTVTTGNSPSVTNSGDDKDVVMDFVFPSGGGVLTGTVEAGKVAKFKADNCAIGMFSLVDGSRVDEYIFTTLTYKVPYSDSATTAYIEDEALCLYSERGDLIYTIIGATPVD